MGFIFWIIWLIGIIMVMTLDSHTDLKSMFKCLWGHRARTVGVLGCSISHFFIGNIFWGVLLGGLFVMNATILYHYEKEYTEKYNKEFNVK